MSRIATLGFAALSLASSAAMAATVSAPVQAQSDATQTMSVKSAPAAQTVAGVGLSWDSNRPSQDDIAADKQVVAGWWSFRW